MLGRLNALAGRPSSWFFLARVVALGSGLATVILTAKLLGPEGRGQVATFAVVAMMAASILGFGTGIAAYSLAAGGRDGARLGSALGVWAGIVGLAGAALGGIALASDVDFGLPDPLKPGLAVLIGGACAAQFLSTSLTQLAIGLERIGTASLGYGLPALLTGAITLLVAVVSPTVLACIVAQVIGWGASALILYHILALPRPHWAELGVLVRRARSAALGEVANALSYRLDVVVIAVLAGASAVGVYSFAVQLLEPLWIVATATASGLLIRLPTAPPGRWPDVARDAVLPVLGLTTIGVVAVVLLVPALVSVIGRGFADAQVVAACLGPGIVLLSGSKVLASYNLAAGRLGAGSVVATASVSVTTLADIILVPKLGAVGGAISATAGYGVSMGLWILLSRGLARRQRLSAAVP
jgi:O-antigen/teichoic acid export membrane protein